MSTIHTRGPTKKNISNWSTDDVGAFLSGNIITRKYRTVLGHYTGNDLLSANESTLAAEGVPFFPRKYLLRKVHSLSQEETISTIKSSPKLSNFKPINLKEKPKDATEPKELKEANDAKEAKEGVVFSLRRFQRVELRRGGGSGIGSGRESPPSKRRRHSKSEKEEAEEQAAKDAKLLLDHYLKEGGEQFSGLYDYLNRNRERGATGRGEEELCTFSYDPPQSQYETQNHEAEKSSLVSLSTEEELCLWFESNNLTEAVPYLLSNHVTPQLLRSERTKLKDLLPMPEPKWKKLESLLWSELPPLDSPAPPPTRPL